jgi:hypothetical protein
MTLKVPLKLFSPDTLLPLQSDIVSIEWACGVPFSMKQKSRDLIPFFA